MSRKDGDKNFLESALSKLTESMWNREDYSGETEDRGQTNKHQRMTREEAEELKRYLKDPKRYVNDTRFKILEQKLRYQNERTAEAISSSTSDAWQRQREYQAELDRRQDEA